jgi:predicted PurR-regulated permease PerM
MANYTMLVARRFQFWWLVLLGLIIFLFLPLLSPILLGITVGIVVIPRYHRWCKRAGRGEEKYKSWVALLFSLFIIGFCILLLALPVIVYLANMERIAESVTDINNGLRELNKTEFAQSLGFSLDLESYKPQIDSWLRNSAGKVAAAAPGQLLGFAVFGLVLYLTVRYGRDVLQIARFAMDSTSRESLDRITDTGYRTLYAIYIVHFATVIVTFVLSLPLFLIIDYEAVLLLAFICALFQLIPFLGPTAVMAGLIIYEIVTHGSGDSALMVHNLVWIGVYGVGVVCLMPDWLLRPYLMGSRSGINSLVLWLGFFGGIAIMGPEGFVFGPLLLALLIEGTREMVERHPDRLLQLERANKERARRERDTEATGPRSSRDTEVTELIAAADPDSPEFGKPAAEAEQTARRDEAESPPEQTARREPGVDVGRTLAAIQNLVGELRSLADSLGGATQAGDGDDDEPAERARDALTRILHLGDMKPPEEPEEPGDAGGTEPAGRDD